VIKDRTMITEDRGCEAELARRAEACCTPICHRSIWHRPIRRNRARHNPTRHNPARHKPTCYKADLALLIWYEPIRPGITGQPTRHPGRRAASTSR
jgi:hypothetical protein